MASAKNVKLHRPARNVAYDFVSTGDKRLKAEVAKAKKAKKRPTRP
jgi:hypothetical protein